MLRKLVLAVGGVGVAAGAVLAVIGNRAAGIYLLCVSAAIVLGTRFERWRYHTAPPPGACWKRTGERFEDPATGKTMEVEYDRASGERRYVHADGSASAGHEP